MTDAAKEVRSTNYQWVDPNTREARSFTCGFCGEKVSSEKGFGMRHPNSVIYGGVYICPSCRNATYFTPDSFTQFPGVAFGNAVAHVPAELTSLYNEARQCTSAGAFTAAVLACRKMLMNIAVKEGAKEGLSFVDYVDHLANKGFVPPNGRHWVDHIRKKGNEANHEIAVMKEKDAKELITFVEMLLRFIYEFPNIVPQPNASTAKQPQPAAVAPPT